MPVAEERLVQEVCHTLGLYWAFRPTATTEIFGGRNSRVWRVTDGEIMAAAKLVRPGDSDLLHFEAGLRVAALLNSATMPTGAPILTASGDYTAAAAGGRLALMRWVPGVPLTATKDADMPVLGTVLARLHDRSDIPSPGVPGWPWQWLSLDGLPVIEPRDRDLVDRAAALTQAGSFTLGIVHGDASPDAFIAATDTIGVIDWASVLHGPVLYDVATLSLVLRRQGASQAQIEAMTSAYSEHSAISAAELRQLDTLRALRLSAEVVYHTSRIAGAGEQNALTTHHDLLRESRRELGEILAGNS
jgi:Ser/Thr protein kinase RdoA (MazF antagonist)